MQKILTGVPCWWGIECYGTVAVVGASSPRGISWLGGRLLASQQRFCSMELIAKHLVLYCRREYWAQAQMMMCDLSLRSVAIWREAQGAALVALSTEMAESRFILIAKCWEAVTEVWSPTVPQLVEKSPMVHYHAHNSPPFLLWPESDGPSSYPISELSSETISSLRHVKLKFCRHFYFSCACYMSLPSHHRSNFKYESPRCAVSFILVCPSTHPNASDAIAGSWHLRL
jgi:hypothetical protein